MDENIVENESWKTSIIVVGGVLGALTGVLAAYLWVQRLVKEEQRPEVSLGVLVRIGLLLLGLVRQVSQLGER